VCAAGQYNADAGILAANHVGCDTCDEGKFTTGVAAVASCTVCTTAGETSNSDSDGCTPCAAGKINTGSTGICVECAAGRYNDDAATLSANHVTCKICAAGRYVVGSGSTGIFDCSACVSGQTSNSDNSGCQSCAVGKINSGSSGMCSICQSGRYNDDPVAVAVPPNHVTCKICAEGKIMKVLGGWHRTGYLCMTCSTSGETSNSGKSQCESCPKGKFNAGTNGICSVCAAGRFNDDPSTASNHLVCTECEAGRFNDDAGLDADLHDQLSDCRVCDFGKYQPTVGTTSCLLCGVGTWNDDEKSTSNSKCRPCIASQYQNEEGIKYCKRCELFNIFLPLLHSCFFHRD